MATTRWDAWLRDARAAGWGGVRLADCPIARGLPFTLPLTIPFDASADAFSAVLLIEPDEDGTPLQTFAVDVGTFDGDATIVTLTLTDSETGDLPADGDLSGVADFVLLVNRTPDGGEEARFLAAVLPAAD